MIEYTDEEVEAIMLLEITETDDIDYREYCLQYFMQKYNENYNEAENRIENLLQKRL